MHKFTNQPSNLFFGTFPHIGHKMFITDSKRKRVVFKWCMSIIYTLLPVSPELAKIQRWGELLKHHFKCTLNTIILTAYKNHALGYLYRKYTDTLVDIFHMSKWEGLQKGYSLKAFSTVVSIYFKTLSKRFTVCVYYTVCICVWWN